MWIHRSHYRGQMHRHTNFPWKRKETQGHEPLHSSGRVPAWLQLLPGQRAGVEVPAAVAVAVPVEALAPAVASAEILQHVAAVLLGDRRYTYVAKALND